MIPVYLQNSSFPVVELKDDQVLDQHLHLFLSPHHAATSLSAHGSFFHTTQDQRGTKLSGESHQYHNHEVYKYVSNGRSSNHKLVSSSSYQPVTNDACNAHNFASCKREDGDCEGSGNGPEVKWMPSKMRLMQKMMNSNSSSEAQKSVKFTVKFQEQQYHHNYNESNSSSNSNSNSNNTSVRVCSDCNTTTTPLWRSGPRGPKSLCNACGIRQRKARRAMAAAVAAEANGTVIAVESTTTSSIKTNKVHKKEKKSHASHGAAAAQCKKMCKPPDHHHHHQGQSQKKLPFKNLALSLTKNSSLQRVFPQDVEEAAILLMELSCGFIHS